MGAAAGVAVDFVINSGIKLVKQDEFQKDITEVLNITKLEWKWLLKSELYNICDIWINDCEQSILQTQAMNNRSQTISSNNENMVDNE